MKKARLHRKVATTIFFESNGGQARGRGHGTRGPPGCRRARPGRRPRRYRARGPVVVVLLPDRRAQPLSVQPVAQPEQAARRSPGQHRAGEDRGESAQRGAGSLPEGKAGRTGALPREEQPSSRPAGADLRGAGARPVDGRRQEDDTARRVDDPAVRKLGPDLQKRPGVVCRR